MARTAIQLWKYFIQQKYFFVKLQRKSRSWNLMIGKKNVQKAQEILSIKRDSQFQIQFIFQNWSISSSMKAKFSLLFLFTHLYLSSPKSKIRIHDCIVKAKYSENIQFYAWLDCRYFSQIFRMDMEKWLTRIKMGLLRYRIL